MKKPIFWIIAGAILLLVAGFLNRPKQPAASGAEVATSEGLDPAASPASAQQNRGGRRGESSSQTQFVPVNFTGTPAERAQAEVRARVSAFAKSRRETILEYAKESGVMVLQDVLTLLKKIESGETEEASKIFKMLEGLNRMGEGQVPPGLREIWPLVSEAHGVMSVARDWPAQALIDYGRTVTEGLPPGTVYLGGSDAGRLIPTLLSDAGGGDSRMILSQSSFADQSYMNLLKRQFGDRLQFPEQAEVDAAFQKILQEQGQKTADGRVQLSGAAAVTAVNEQLLKLLMEKNPGTRFAVQEFQPMPGVYAGAEISGPLMVVGGAGSDQARALPLERAVQGADYWQGTVDRLRGDSAVQSSPAAREGWAELAVAQAGLLAANSHNSQAEAVYRSATQIAPDSLLPVERWAEWLARSGRVQEAVPLVQQFASQHPDQAGAVEALLKRIGASSN